MSARQPEAVFTIREAAEWARVSEDTIKRAIRATSGPTLRAKKLGRG